MKEFTSSFWIVMDVAVALVIVFMLLTNNQLTARITQTVELDRAATAEVQEYRKALMYEGATCYTSDIVSLLLEYQGQPTVYIYTSSNTVRYAWDPSKTPSSVYNPTAYNATAIYSKLGTSRAYVCSVLYDANGSVCQYQFKEV